MRTLVLVHLCLGLSLATACGGDSQPVDVSGTYALSVTNGANECMLPNWTVGQQSVGQVNLVLTQQADRSQVSGQVVGSGGFVEALFRLAYGSNSFTGTVSGTDVAMELISSGQPEMAGACTFTRNARAVAKVDKDTITGNLFHYYKTNGVPDCGYRTTCNNAQSFNGTRPPK
jgi:hypothetical protein